MNQINLQYSKMQVMHYNNTKATENRLGRIYTFVKENTTQQQKKFS